MAGDAPPTDAAARAEALLAAAEAAAQAAAAARAQAMAALEAAPAASGARRPRPAAATAIGAGTPGTAGPGGAGGGAAASAAPGRDPTAPARLLALAEELAARTHDARHQLDALADAVERALAAAGPRAAGGGAGGGAGGTASGGRPGPTAEDLRAATARLVAVEMALAGASRAEVSDVLARAFGTADDRLLDEVLDGAPPPGRPPAGG